MSDNGTALIIGAVALGAFALTRIGSTARTEERQEGRSERVETRVESRVEKVETRAEARVEKEEAQQSGKTSRTIARQEGKTDRLEIRKADKPTIDLANVYSTPEKQARAEARTEAVITTSGLASPVIAKSVAKFTPVIKSFIFNPIKTIRTIINR